MLTAPPRWQSLAKGGHELLITRFGNHLHKMDTNVVRTCLHQEYVQVRLTYVNVRPFTSCTHVPNQVRLYLRRLPPPYVRTMCGFYVRRHSLGHEHIILRLKPTAKKWTRA